MRKRGGWRGREKREELVKGINWPFKWRRENGGGGKEGKAYVQ